MTDTQDRIKAMALEAGGDPPGPENWWALHDDELAKFAALVAEDCAKVCDGMPYRAAGASKAAQSIRARYGAKEG